MSERIIKNYRHNQSGNKGDWVSAKIYSDNRNGCACGGKFDASGEMDNVPFPKCSSCGKSPTLFRIRAKVITEDLRVKYLDIRHKKGGKRLTRVHECIDVFERVSEELKNGVFNYRDYDSEEGRKEFIFENYAAKYLEYHKKRAQRGELSPSGIANKKTSINNLLKYFQGRDIGTIRRSDVEEFKNSWTDKFRARDLALSELKALFNHGVKVLELPLRPPKFDLVPASRKRKEIIDLETASMVIQKIEDPLYQFMLKLLTVYPVRPGELRALQWQDVDYFGAMVTFRRHFSRDVLLDGRKSMSSGDKAEVSLPLTDEFKEWLLCQPRPLHREAFIFPGKTCAFVTGKCLSRAWRKATKKLKLPDYELYEMRHARLSEIAEQTKGDMVKMIRISGHSNPKTLMDRYVRDTSDLKELFQ